MPAAIQTVTPPSGKPFDTFNWRIASLARCNVANGPSVASLFGESIRPNHWSLPFVETKKSVEADEFVQN
jgi:hypothetical protein